MPQFHINLGFEADDAHREIRVTPSAPGRDVLLVEMRAFQYMPNGRFRKIDVKPGQLDDEVLVVVLSGASVEESNAVVIDCTCI